MQKKTTYQQLLPVDRFTIATMRQRGLVFGPLPVLWNERRLPLLARWLASPVPCRAMLPTTRNCVRWLAGIMPAAIASCIRKVCARAWCAPCSSGSVRRNRYRLLSSASSFTNASSTCPHETIYTATYAQARGELRRELIACLTDLAVYSQEDLDAFADSLNSRPRATRNWLTPLKVYVAALASAHQPDTFVQSQPLHFRLEIALSIIVDTLHSASLAQIALVRHCIKRLRTRRRKRTMITRLGWRDAKSPSKGSRQMPLGSEPGRVSDFIDAQP